MNTTKRTNLIGILKQTFAAHAQESDSVLLDRFAQARDEAAFSTLVMRHGPMVLSACRRVLGDHQAAEDAFQATFLVLAKKAATLPQQETLAGWLYGVARRAAMKTRSVARLPTTALTEDALPPAPGRDPLSELSGREVLVILDEEINRLPTTYRMVVVLCCLEGLTIDEVVRRLHSTPGAVRGRLERGRERLHARLAARGLMPASVLAIAVMAQATYASTLGLQHLAVRSSCQFLTNAGKAAGTVPAIPRLIAEGVLNTMLISKLKVVGYGFLTLVLIAGPVLADGLSLPKPPAKAAHVATHSFVVKAELSLSPTSSDNQRALERVEWDRVAGLLRQESVRKEIGLSNDDYKTLANYRKDRRVMLQKKLESELNTGGITQKAEGQENRQGAAEAELIEQYQAALRALEVEWAKKATETLKPAGVNRLKQAILQSAGPRGLLDRVAIRELQLTAEQEDKIAKLIGPPRFWLTVVPNVRLEKLAKDQDAVLEAALKLLTPDQRKTWDTLVGKPLPTVDLLKAGPTSEDSMADLTNE